MAQGRFGCLAQLLQGPGRPLPRGIALSIQVGNEYIPPTAEGAAKDVEASSLDKKDAANQYMFPYTLERTSTDTSQYPIVLVSYLLACTESKNGPIVKGFLNYVISEEGQKAAQKNAGNAPISDATREQIQPAVDAIKG